MDHGMESVRVGPSPHGLGVFSRRALHRRERIGPIEGRVIDDPKYESPFCMAFGRDSALEPAAPLRYLNHSCRPNCALVEIERTWRGRRSAELWLEVEADVLPGDQLTIDYGWPAKAAIPCGCGCPECRGWIVAEEELAAMKPPPAEAPPEAAARPDRA
jgi:hypothetical protein